jgi:uncharacterized protein YbjT (DUF2867 family)
MLSPDLKRATHAEHLEALIGCRPFGKSEEDMKVLVTGATGNVGSVVVGELLKRGAEVRALIRKPDADHKLPASVEVAIGDLLDPVSIEEAMKGVDKLFLLNAVVADELTQAFDRIWHRKTNRFEACDLSVCLQGAGVPRRATFRL